MGIFRDDNDDKQGGETGSLASKLDKVDPKTREELRRVYDAESERVGWAQAAETLGHALARYGASRSGVSGVEIPRTDWERKQDRILNKYKVDLSDLAGKEAEQKRQEEREADRALRISESEKDRQLRLSIEQQREKAKAAEEAKKQEKLIEQGTAIEELAALKEEEGQQVSKIRGLQQALKKYRNKKGQLSEDKLDDRDEVEGLLSDLEAQGIVDESVRKEVLDKAEEDSPFLPNFLEDAYDGSKVIEILHEVIAKKDKGLQQSRSRIPSTTRRARGFPASDEAEGGEDIKMVRGVPYRLGKDGNYHKVK